MLDERELEIVRACKDYAVNHANAGLPGHNLVIIIAKLSALVDIGVNPHYAYNAEPEDHKEYTAYDKDRFKKPLAQKVMTKYGR